MQAHAKVAARGQSKACPQREVFVVCIELVTARRNHCKEDWGYIQEGFIDTVALKHDVS